VSATNKKVEAASSKPYPVYKLSSVEWLGEIPAHWETRRLKYLATVNDEALAETADPNMEISYVDIGNVDSVEGITGREDLVLKDAPSRARRIVHQGDVIISTVRTYLRAIARIEAADANVIVSTGFAVIRPRELDDGFCAYALRAPYFVECVVANSVGVSYPAINASDLACLDIAFPPLSEQRAIAAFLDRETARIDSLIVKKERLIELLQEKRIALISQAVTKGLDPDVPMKDFGIEWLGEIPAHWEVKRLRVAANIQTGVALGKRYKTSDLVTRPYLRVANVQDGYLVLDDVAEIQLPSKEAPRYELRTNDVLLTEGGDFDKLGRGHVWSGQIPFALHQNHIFVVRPNQRMMRSEFLSILLASSYGRAYFTATSKQSTNLASTNSRQLSIFPIPMPSLDEQHSIISSLDHESEKLDMLIAKVQEAIVRLKELRTALISAAVTGKIDVREEAA